MFAVCNWALYEEKQREWWKWLFKNFSLFNWKLKMTLENLYGRFLKSYIVLRSTLSWRILGLITLNAVVDLLLISCRFNTDSDTNSSSAAAKVSFLAVKITKKKIFLLGFGWVLWGVMSIYKHLACWLIHFLLKVNNLVFLCGKKNIITRENKQSRFKSWLR